jgi:chromate transport protein ChrA
MSEILGERDTKIPLWAKIVSWILGGLTYLIAILIFIIGFWGLGKSTLNEIKEFGLILASLAMLFAVIWKHVIGVKRL